MSTQSKSDSYAAAGVDIVAGYKAEMFYYLEEKLGVKIIVNPDF